MADDRIDEQENTDIDTEATEGADEMKAPDKVKQGANQAGFPAKQAKQPEQEAEEDKETGDIEVANK